MSGKKFKSHASSSRAAAGGFGGGSHSPFGGFSTAGPAQETPTSSLSYVYEPPDLSQISNPQIVVTFKNLLKKDSTTKARALEDLQSHVSNVVSSNSSLDDGLLEAWVRSPFFRNSQIIWNRSIYFFFFKKIVLFSLRFTHPPR